MTSGTPAGGITVAVCTRGRPAMASACVGRILQCDPAPLEIVVIDQSDDAKTRLLLGSLPRGRPPVRVIPTPSRGLSRARNIALVQARGELLAFTDDDCLPRRDWVGAVGKAFERWPEADCVTGPALPETTEELDERAAAVTTWNPPGPVLHRGVKEPSAVGGGFNMTFRRDSLLRLGGFDERLGPGVPLGCADDTDILHRLLRRGGVVAYTPGAVVSHEAWRDAPEQARTDRRYALSRGGWAALALRSGDPWPLGLATRTFLRSLSRSAGGLLRMQMGTALYHALLAASCARGFLLGLVSPRGRAPLLGRLLEEKGAGR